ncbi:hypothetical protein G6F58_013893 [Rhizopus delemar]|uniref:Uncharacterized protein n=1 Tax=Rhizopus delemar TaxID=936053 RepID=A0A9P6XZV3_9FUNG|nr:hypothetical protein G6F59_017939 [Rhizopus arrhizus]KAG1386019.1 hypothetical protein G6F58_013893 [Rhizopus delemar]KAG1536239.1 hypothetical protein G6F50_015116 [Rhizopus delemar]
MDPGGSMNRSTSTCRQLKAASSTGSHSSRFQRQRLRRGTSAPASTLCCSPAAPITGASFFCLVVGALSGNRLRLRAM